MKFEGRQLVQARKLIATGRVRPEQQRAALEWMRSNMLYSQALEVFGQEGASPEIRAQAFSWVIRTDPWTAIAYLNENPGSGTRLSSISQKDQELAKKIMLALLPMMAGDRYLIANFNKENQAIISSIANDKSFLAQVDKQELPPKA